jgi:hypothetical protein
MPFDCMMKSRQVIGNWQQTDDTGSITQACTTVDETTAPTRQHGRQCGTHCHQWRPAPRINLTLLFLMFQLVFQLVVRVPCGSMLGPLNNQSTTWCLVYDRVDSRRAWTLGVSQQREVLHCLDWGALYLASAARQYSKPTQR